MEHHITRPDAWIARVALSASSLMFKPDFAPVGLFFVDLMPETRIFASKSLALDLQSEEFVGLAFIDPANMRRGPL
jgi:hypothetical protein